MDMWMWMCFAYFSVDFQNRLADWPAYDIQIDILLLCYFAFFHLFSSSFSVFLIDTHNSIYWLAVYAFYFFYSVYWSHFVSCFINEIKSFRLLRHYLLYCRRYKKKRQFSNVDLSMVALQTVMNNDVCSWTQKHTRIYSVDIEEEEKKNVTGKRSMTMKISGENLFMLSHLWIHDDNYAKYREHTGTFLWNAFIRETMWFRFD